MKIRRLFALAALVTALPAQSFFIPDTDATTGACNVFPFGSTGGLNIKYQQLVTAAELGNQAGLITGIGFAQCGAGSHHFDALEIVLDHKPGAALVANFAQNVTAGASTVLSCANYDWNLPADSWQDVGLQGSFAYNGVDNLVVQVTARGSHWAPGGTGSSGLRSGNHPRVYASGWNAAPPAVGTLATTFALKIEIDMGIAKVSSHGRGCFGSNGLAPRMSVTGLPQLGQTIVFELADALPATLGVRILALDNGVPFPFDLTIVGMPGCWLYQDLLDVSAWFVGVAGTASAPFAVPALPALVGTRLYGQWGCLDPAANAFGWTTSNYARAQIGI